MFTDIQGPTMVDYSFILEKHEFIATIYIPTKDHFHIECICIRIILRNVVHRSMNSLSDEQLSIHRDSYCYCEHVLENTPCVQVDRVDTLTLAPLTWIYHKTLELAQLLLDLSISLLFHYGSTNEKVQICSKIY